MEISDYEQYYQKGGTYVFPIEVFNELWGEMKNWKDNCKQKENIIKELEKDLYKIRELTFTKYNSNEWNNCLSFNDDILPVINKLQELKGDSSNE